MYCEMVSLSATEKIHIKIKREGGETRKETVNPLMGLREGARENKLTPNDG